LFLFFRRIVLTSLQISKVEDYYKNLSGEVPSRAKVNFDRREVPSANKDFDRREVFQGLRQEGSGEVPGRPSISGSRGAPVNKYEGASQIGNGKIGRGSGTTDNVRWKVEGEERLGEAQNRQNARVEAQRLKEEKARAEAERQAEENLALSNEKMFAEKKKAKAKRLAQEQKAEESRLAEERRKGESEVARLPAERRLQETEQRTDLRRPEVFHSLRQEGMQAVPFPGEVQQPEPDAEHTGRCCIIM
jgi:hypothetical protein